MVIKLIIPKVLLNIILDNCRTSYPRECCGLLIGQLVGKNKSVATLWAATNADGGSPFARYSISPEDLMASEKYAQALGLEIIGVYHSHPDYPAHPSEFDRERAFPLYSYIIVSVNHGEPGDVTSWTLRADGSSFDPDDLVTRA